MPDIDLRLGCWQDVLADVEQVDAVICDPPYSERTASGYKTNPEWSREIGSQPGVEYGFITEQDVADFVGWWWRRCRHWMLVFGDHVSARWWESSLSQAGAYVFAPLPYIRTDGAPRFVGDGPTSLTDWLVVARHRSTTANGSPRRGSRPGWYQGSCRRGEVTGAKDLRAMRQIVGEYTLPGDLVCDPFSGSGTTARACVTEGRRFVGAERDPGTYRVAMDRLRGLGPTGKPQLSIFDRVAAPATEDTGGR